MAELIHPRFGARAYVAQTAYISGEVVCGDDFTAMHHVVVRGDIAPIRIGARVNVQDGSILHTPHGIPLDIADDVGIGHRAVVHCRRVGPRTLIGIGSILLDNAQIGTRCVIAAGSLVPPGMQVPDDSVLMGVPGRIVRSTSARDLEIIDHVVKSYVMLGRKHAEGLFPNTAPPSPNSR